MVRLQYGQHTPALGFRDSWSASQRRMAGCAGDFAPTCRAFSAPRDLGGPRLRVCRSDHRWPPSADETGHRWSRDATQCAAPNALIVD